jgi:hypothetical protein
MHFMYETSIPVHVSDLGLALKGIFQLTWGHPCVVHSHHLHDMAHSTAVSAYSLFILCVRTGYCAFFLC